MVHNSGMNKQTALNYSIKALLLRDDAIYRAAVLSVTFGSADALTIVAFADADKFAAVSRRWEAVALLHPATRAKLIRDMSLPAEMFV